MTASTPKFPGFGERNEGEIVHFLEKAEQRGKWPQQACTTMFVWIPKNVTSERPIAQMPTLKRWWEALRGQKWQNGNRSIVLTETLPTFEMEEPSKQCGKFCWRWKDSMVKAKEEDQGALALVLDLTTAFERVILPVVWARATHFSFPRKILRVLCGHFEIQRRVQLEGCVPSVEVEGFCG